MGAQEVVLLGWELSKAIGTQSLLSAQFGGMCSPAFGRK